MWALRATRLRQLQATTLHLQLEKEPLGLDTAASQVVCLV
jgi:hypothetical protein